MYSAGTSAEYLGPFSLLEAGTIQEDPWPLVCFKRAFTIHKASLPNQFSCLKCSDSWVADPVALTSLKPLSVVIMIIIIIITFFFLKKTTLCFYSSHAKNIYPGFIEGSISRFKHSDCVSLNIRIQINGEKIVFASFKPF